MTDYLLDANVFIQAKNLHYGFDFCPAFWDWLVVQNEAGKENQDPECLHRTQPPLRESLRDVATRASQIHSWADSTGRVNE